jgi:DNA polymerase-3 subunit gamma/tau
MASFVHFVTTLKVAPAARADAAVTEEEATRGRALAAGLSVPVLGRAWQILTKGLQELNDSPRPIAAADMVLVRLAYAADLPTPDEALRRLAGAVGASSGRASGPPSGSPSGPAGQSQSSASGGASAALRIEPAPDASARASAPPQAQARVVPASAPRVQIARFEDLVALAQTHRDIQLKVALERDVRPVRFERGTIEFSLAPGGSPQIAAHLMRRLQEWTGERWMVAISTAQGAPTLREAQEARDRARATGVRADPLVRSVLERFPGAEIVAVRSLAPEPGPEFSSQTADAGDEVAYVDQGEDDDDI